MRVIYHLGDLGRASGSLATVARHRRELHSGWFECLCHAALIITVLALEVAAAAALAVRAHQAAAVGVSAVQR